MKQNQNYRPDQNTFLDTNIQYKTGLKNNDNETLLANAKKEALIRAQMKANEEKKQLIKEQLKQIKAHEIKFGSVNIYFKFSIILCLIAFVANIVLSIIYKNLFWGNIFNIVAAVVLFYASKYLHPMHKEDTTQQNISNILHRNILQISCDLLNYKTPKFIREHAEKIVDIITISATICFAIFPATNILYAVSMPLIVFSIFLLFALQKREELNSHLQLLNLSLLIGVIIKAIYNIIFTSNFIQIDYMNMVLLFIFTYMSMCLIPPTNDTNEAQI